MESKIEYGSMRDHINTVYLKLINDEYLMRLLYFKPRSPELNMPLDQKILLDSDEYWDIVDDRVLTSTKSTDIEEKEICRIYIYPGRRRPFYNNYLFVKQEIVIDVLVHESYSNDLRQEWICDRINELLVLERITGIGKVDYAGGSPRQAPLGFDRYENIYVIGDTKK